MKLNNKGWGLSVLLAFIGVFFVAIILISYLSNKYGYGPTNTSSTNPTNTLVEKYRGYETEVKEAAVKYQEEHYPNIDNGDQFYINISKLNIGSYIKSSCTGYVKYGKTNDLFYYDPYLKCGDYETNGYISDFDI